MEVNENLVRNDTFKSLKEAMEASSIESYIPENVLDTVNLGSSNDEEDLEDIGMDKLGEMLKKEFHIELDDI